MIAVGRTSEVHEFGRHSVVKILRSTVPSHWAEREADFTSAVRELGAPAPEVHGLIEIEGRPAIVFERIFGQSMWEAMQDSPPTAPGLARELGKIQKSIMAAGLPNEVPGLVERMRVKISEAVQLTPSERSTAQDVLVRLPRGAALLHGDLHPGNVLMAQNGPVVIDWFDSSIGHPLADVARSSLLLRPLGEGRARPHLPTASPEFLDAIHSSYLEEMVDVIEERYLPTFEALSAAGRLAEDAEVDESALLDLWRRRAPSF